MAVGVCMIDGVSSLRLSRSPDEQILHRLLVFQEAHKKAEALSADTLQMATSARIFKVAI